MCLLAKAHAKDQFHADLLNYNIDIVRKNLAKMTLKRSSDIQKFSRENVEILLCGPRTETKFVKWSATRKRLRTAELTSTYTVIFSSIQLPLTRTIGPSYYFINPSSTEGKLFNLFYRIMSFTAINKSIRHWGNQIIRLRVFSP